MSFILLLRPIFHLFRSFPRGFSPPRGSKENQRADLIRRRSGIRSQQWGPPPPPSAVSSHCASLAFPAFSRTNFSPRSCRFHIPPQGPVAYTHIRALSLSRHRFILSRKPDHASWILFASSLVLALARGRNCGYQPRSGYPGNHEESFTFPSKDERERKRERERERERLGLEGGEGIEGRTCKPISSWRSILVASRRTVAKQSDTGYGIPLYPAFGSFHDLFTDRRRTPR